MSRKDLQNFIESLYPERVTEIMSLFDRYHQLLTEQNSRINLVSRKTSENDYWNLHYLDSLLPLSKINLDHLSILDFGTGGGLPGIPLKITCPNSTVYLLDSREKKIQVIRNIIKKLDLKRCFTIVSRLESLDQSWDSRFDAVVCRSVRIESRYVERLLCLIKTEGKLILYKAKDFEDTELFPDREIIDISHPEIGTRKIIVIRKQEGYGKNHYDR
ncbi:MAG: 16S rRNA (guanine(527)-N(7))-methyltransferase RsmG [Candidatus Cloacimonetes bacterium]|nr:16S rRNA (guanine(527)-N(7))-methyltransferase RsmG [Candidatus Cloacimonadota bacterium]